jgi:superfamily II DNA/RNA helicase
MNRGAKAEPNNSKARVDSYKTMIKQRMPPARQILSHPPAGGAFGGAGFNALFPQWLQPRPHQELVRQHMLRNRGLLVVHGTGTGKTLTASFVARDFLNEHGQGMVIIVCPAGVKPQFYAEIGTAVPAADMARVYPFGYEELVSMADGLQTGGTLRNKIQTYETLLIVDEAHYLNKTTSTRGNTILDLAVMATKVMVMTATPITNKVNELAVLLAFVSGKRSFVDLKMDQLSDAEFRDVVGCRVSMYNRDEDDPAFPRMVEHDPIYIPLSDADHAFAISNFHSYTNQRNYARERAKLISQGDKLDTMFELMRRYPGKTIVYVEMKHNVDRLKSFLDEKRVPYQTIVGNVKTTNRFDIVKKFSAHRGTASSSSMEVMILSKAGQTGLDFKRVRNVIFLELPWNYSDYKQIIGRAARFGSHPNGGQRATVNVFTLLYRAPDNKSTVVNQVAWNIIGRKKQETAQIMVKLLPLTIERLGACRPRGNRPPGNRNARPNTPNTPNARPNAAARPTRASFQVSTRRFPTLGQAKRPVVLMSPFSSPVTPELRNETRKSLERYVQTMLPRRKPAAATKQSGKKRKRRRVQPRRADSQTPETTDKTSYVLHRARSSPPILMRHSPDKSTWEVKKPPGSGGGGRLTSVHAMLTRRRQLQELQQRLRQRPGSVASSSSRSVSPLP